MKEKLQTRSAFILPLLIITVSGVLKVKAVHTCPLVALNTLQKSVELQADWWHPPMRVSIWNFLNRGL